MDEGLDQLSEEATRPAGGEGRWNPKRWTAVVVIGLALSACGDSTSDNCVQGGPPDLESITFAGSLGIDLAQMTRLQNGLLYIRDDVIGTGQETFDNALLRVRYAGWYADGLQFDSGQNFPFQLGDPSIIAGWNLGILGMRQGGTRTLVISPTLGYGPCPFRQIPGNSVLVFEVEMLQVGG